ncbi:MAG: chemotaxis protein CheD [Desulfobulbaceae bacterium]|nr:chemotaxis protein CheD [Desulfobulbaceae bacterium]MCK5340771.1 chemotaxis protein CheD [Desulfobulbaceae bacterium]MCK5404564.1 chemotaxis protein CheD [Desulfobulbaceae bacterium]
MAKIIVGISDMKVSNNPQDVLVTYSLGSCIGLAIWDQQLKVGGLLHYMLPDSKLDKARAEARPFMFADVGVPRLFKEAYALGARKENLIVKVVGGAQIMDSAGLFNIGQRNYQILIRMFQKNKITIVSQDVGGTVNRTVSLHVATGSTRLKVSGREECDL